MYNDGASTGAILDEDEQEYLLKTATMPGEKDARIMVMLSDDHMEAVINGYQPQQAGGAALTIPILMQNLLQHNVLHGLLRSAMQELFLRLKKGEDIVGLTIARGNPPQAAQDARLRLLGNPQYPVLPEEPVAELVPGVPYTPGKDVCGGEIHDHSLCREYNIKIDYTIGEGCHLDEGRQVIVSEYYGLARLAGRHISIEPLHRVSTDKMSLSLTIYPYDYHNRLTEAHHIRRAVLPLRLGMPCNTQVVLDAISQALKDNKPVEAEGVVQGRLPVNGMNGMLSFSELQTVTLPGHCLRGSDPKEQKLYHAQQGQLIAHLRQPESGTPGMDIFGHKIPACPGKPVIFMPGENVNADYRSNSFYAEEKGIVVIEDYAISIRPLKYIQEDFGPQHLRFVRPGNNCCLVVHGAVVCGTQAKGVGNLICNSGMEDVEFSVSGDISLLGGICMSTGSNRTIRCRNLNAHHANNARIEASGDVIIASEIINCHIQAGGVVEATCGKGQLIGGITTAGRGIIVNEAGSRMCACTILRAGQADTYTEYLRLYAKELQDELSFLGN